MLNTPPMVSMEMTPEQKAENSAPTGLIDYDPPKYPYGLCLSLESEQLEALEVDFDSIEVGGTYHLFVLAKVTAKSSSDRESGKPCKRVELQVTHMAAESEDAENEEKEPTRKKMYKK